MRAQAKARVEAEHASCIFRGEISVGFGDVVDTAMCLLNCEQGGRGRSVDMQRRRLSGRGRSGARPVEMSITKNDSFDWR